MMVKMLVHVTAVECVGPRAIRVWFDDQAVKDVDLSQELWGEVFEPLRDPDFFRQVYVNEETGTIEWPNGADLAPTFLYEKGVGVSTS
ncbi:MAG: DUF2442 domain-containing protein [Gemmatimonadota bacterium]|nr:DUF2442 domain-containing protein [Gemmatimonadota bacterium]MDH3423975.1 DUF2442 domain-containing protein [Gemmatimonadota bacterium]